MVSEEPLHEQLRSTADALQGRVWDSATTLMRTAAAEIEGHNEAFSHLVRCRQEAVLELGRAQKNTRSAYEFIARWRELLVALHAAHPDDIRIKRALAGEHPMRPAPWERQP